MQKEPATSASEAAASATVSPGKSEKNGKLWRIAKIFFATVTISWTLALYVEHFVPLAAHSKTPHDCIRRSSNCCSKSNCCSNRSKGSIKSRSSNIASQKVQLDRWVHSTIVPLRFVSLCIASISQFSAVKKILKYIYIYKFYMFNLLLEYICLFDDICVDI